MAYIKDTTRKLRREQTPSEAKVWEIVRDRRVKGKKFLRQHPIRFLYYGRKRFFVADFYCAKLKLVLEIDGKVHERQKDYDELRTFIINQLGIKVVRVTNEAVADTEKFREWLEALATDSPSLSILKKYRKPCQ